jgi:hypothetical protein
MVNEEEIRRIRDSNGKSWFITRKWDESGIIRFGIGNKLIFGFLSCCSSLFESSIPKFIVVFARRSSWKRRKLAARTAESFELQ